MLTSVFYKHGKKILMCLCRIWGASVYISFWNALELLS